jgi:hypothetical protein
MKKLPLYLAITHALLASLAFGFAMSSLHWDVFPRLIAIIDLPASLLASWLCDLLESTMLIEAFIYVVIGSVWFYLIGIVVRIIARKFRSTP